MVSLWCCCHYCYYKGRKVWHHDYLFWCGDFNYRIDLTKEEVIDLIQTENFAGLQAYDQLNTQRQSGAVTLQLIRLPPFIF